MDLQVNRLPKEIKDNIKLVDTSIENIHLLRSLEKTERINFLEELRSRNSIIIDYFRYIFRTTDPEDCKLQHYDLNKF